MAGFRFCSILNALGPPPLTRIVRNKEQLSGGWREVIKQGEGWEKKMRRAEKCLGRVAKVVVNAPSVGPNRRATRRSVAGYKVLSIRNFMTGRGWRQLLYCPNKVVAARRSPRVSFSNPIDPTAEPLVRRNHLEVC